jgi:hypothetical protein
MNNDPKSVWERYVQTWKTPSLEDKRALFAQCLTPDCVYRDPLTEARGWDELEAYMATLQTQIPGAYFVTEHFLAHHGRSIARWQMMNGENVAVGSGISYGEYDAQGRLCGMSGFFETPGSTA